MTTDASPKISSIDTAVTFWKCGTCSEGTMNTLDRAFDHPMETEEHGVMPLAGGIAQHGYQCGILWGSACAAGAEACRRHGTGSAAEATALRAAQGIVESFQARNGSINCLEITETDWTKKSQMLLNFLKGGPITCTLMTVKFAPLARDEIQAALSEEPGCAACSPVSCAAELVRKLGMSDEHAAMVAGFAGGIGLSGGACGALGAAVWVLGMDSARQGLGYNGVNARNGQVIEAFLKSSGHEFECAEIVGRTFEDIEDHAEHLRTGGCAAIIDALAAATRAELEPREQKLSA